MQRKSDPMVFLVSFPRSGQHFSQKLLQDSSGHDDYCEYYNCWVGDCPAKNFPAKLRAPCYSGKRLQKNHDFDGDFPCFKAFRYAVLYRHPVPSIQSFYEWCIRRLGGIQIKRDGKKAIVPDSAEAWEIFAGQQAIYWRDFVGKWVRQSRAENVRCFPYETLVSDPGAMRDFVRFCTPSAPDHLIEAAVGKQVETIGKGARPLRDPGSFRYDARSVVDRIAETTDEAFALAYR